MIDNLECTVTFAASGFTLAASFQPQTGITAVVGPNGTGKSLSTIETTRYLLYGKKALRGPASGYKKLDVKGDFTIRGERYHIERRDNHESITDATGKVLAVGAKAVTEQATALMGYGLDVFDICNASVQGDTHLFSKMQPAERKRMIDRVVGLASNEAVEKACRTEASAIRREIDALSRALVAPVAPTARFPGQLSTEIAEALETARSARKRWSEISRKTVPITRPTKPDMPMPHEADIRIIEDHQDHFRDVQFQRERLRKVLAVDAPLPGYTEANLQAAESRARKRKQLEALGPKPTLTQEVVEHQLQVWMLYDTHVISDEVTCPNCNHMFRPTGDIPLSGGYDKAFLRDEAKRLARWEGVDDTLPDGVDLTINQIAAARDAIAAYEAHQKAQDEEAALPRVVDKSDQLRTLRERQAAWNTYLSQQLAYERAREINLAVDAELAELGNTLSDSEIDRLAEDLADARLFEGQWAAWDKAKIAYDATLVEIEDKRVLAEEFRKGGDALADARATVKAFLAPALSRVASSLLYDMTHGQLPTVHIDDDMNILVGSQSLETLSGGGLTAANIALRIALGQVLVADTFPVFLGDEIDADVDDVRREAIVESLVGLKKHLDQIILVTHRSVGVADHVHSLSDL